MNHKSNCHMLFASKLPHTLHQPSPSSLALANYSWWLNDIGITASRWVQVKLPDKFGLQHSTVFVLKKSLTFVVLGKVGRRPMWTFRTPNHLDCEKGFHHWAMLPIGKYGNSFCLGASTNAHHGANLLQPPSCVSSAELPWHQLALLLPSCCWYWNVKRRSSNTNWLKDSSCLSKSCCLIVV